MTTVYRAAPNGRLLSWSPGTGWLEVESSQPVDPEVDIERLMKGRTAQEAQSARNALARRAARRRPTTTVTRPPRAADHGYLAASRARPLERTTIIEGGVVNT